MPEKLSYDEKSFWEEVYVKSIERGDPSMVARVLANQAIVDRKNAVGEAENEEED